MSASMFTSSYSPADIRAQSLRLVIDVAQAKGELFRSDISRLTGMTAPTVMKVVKTLKSRGPLTEAGAVNTRMGRRPTRLRFRPGGGDHFNAGFIASLAQGLTIEDSLRVGNAVSSLYVQ